jgi:HAD superfamily hydrolase (TIGR01509 family)
MAATPACVVFDCDGLLLDTESAWTRAEVELYGRHGLAFTMDHKREMLGTAGPVSRGIMERHLGRPGDGAELAAELHELVMAEVGRSAPPRPGAVELVEALRAQGTPVGLASNSFRGFVDTALAVSGLAGHFDLVVTSEEVAHPKPAPDVYLESCRRLGADPTGSVALEDSPTGVSSAVEAGMFVVAVPSLEGVDLSAAHLLAPSLGAEEVWRAVGLRLAA